MLLTPIVSLNSASHKIGLSWPASLPSSSLSPNSPASSSSSSSSPLPAPRSLSRFNHCIRYFCCRFFSLLCCCRDVCSRCRCFIVGYCRNFSNCCSSCSPSCWCFCCRCVPVSSYMFLAFLNSSHVLSALFRYHDCDDSCSSFHLFCLSNAMHGQNINLPVCVCLCVCVRHTFCQLVYRSDPSTDFLQLIA